MNPFLENSVPQSEYNAQMKISRSVLTFKFCKARNHIRWDKTFHTILNWLQKFPSVSVMAFNKCPNISAFRLMKMLYYYSLLSFVSLFGFFAIIRCNSKTFAVSLNLRVELQSCKPKKARVLKKPLFRNLLGYRLD